MKNILVATDLMVRGDATNVVMAAAASSACDMIVVGSHGRTGLKRLLLGSVAERIVRHASCSVLVVR